MGGGWVGGWEAEGGLHHPIGLFGVGMSPRSVSHRPRQAWRALRETSYQLRGKYQTHTSHLVPSMAGADLGFSEGGG